MKFTSSVVFLIFYFSSLAVYAKKGRESEKDKGFLTYHSKDRIASDGEDDDEVVWKDGGEFIHISKSSDPNYMESPVSSSIFLTKSGVVCFVDNPNLNESDITNTKFTVVLREAKPLGGSPSIHLKKFQEYYFEKEKKDSFAYNEYFDEVNSLIESHKEHQSCRIIIKYSMKSRMLTVGKKDVYAFCLSSQEKMADFENTLKLIYEKIVEEAQLTEIFFAEMGKPFLMGIWDSIDPNEYNKKYTRLLEQSVAFFGQSEGFSSLKIGFRYSKIKNCEVAWNTKVPLRKPPTKPGENQTSLPDSRCCIGFDIDWTSALTSKAVLCSIELEASSCVFKIKSVAHSIQSACLETLDLAKKMASKADEKKSIMNVIAKDMDNPPNITVEEDQQNETAKNTSEPIKQSIEPKKQDLPLDATIPPSQNNASSSAKTSPINHTREIILHNFDKGPALASDNEKKNGGSGSSSGNGSSEVNPTLDGSSNKILEQNSDATKQAKDGSCGKNGKANSKSDKPEIVGVKAEDKQIANDTKIGLNSKDGETTVEKNGEKSTSDSSNPEGSSSNPPPSAKEATSSISESKSEPSQSSENSATKTEVKGSSTSSKDSTIKSEEKVVEEKSEEAAHESDEPSTKSEGATPKAEAVAPKPGEAPPKSDGAAAPKTDESAESQESGESTPQSEVVTPPKTADAATNIKPVDSAPKPTNAAPKPIDAEPNPTDPAPKPTVAPAKPTDAAPAKPTDAAPKPSDAVPKPTDAVPKPTDAVPKPTDAVPKPTEAAPIPNGVPPKSEEAPLDSVETVAESGIVAPKANVAVPKPNEPAPLSVEPTSPELGTSSASGNVPITINSTSTSNGPASPTPSAINSSGSSSVTTSNSSITSSVITNQTIISSSPIETTIENKKEEIVKKVLPKVLQKGPGLQGLFVKQGVAPNKSGYLMKSNTNLQDILAKISEDNECERLFRTKSVSS